MNPANASLYAALLFVAAAASAQTAPASKLRFDPFDWSALRRLSEATPAISPSGAAVAPAPAPRLRAVMRGPSGAHADLDGAILGIGDSANGYRLLQVREYSAVFAKGSAILELQISEGPKK